MLGMLAITAGQLVTSFYILGANSSLASLQFSTIGMTSLACFGICLSGVCYHTHSIENVWKITEELD